MSMDMHNLKGQMGGGGELEGFLIFVYVYTLRLFLKWFSVLIFLNFFFVWCKI